MRSNQKQSRGSSSSTRSASLKFLSERIEPAVASAKTAFMLLLLASFVALAGIGCDEVDERISPSTPTPISTTGTGSPEPPATSTSQDATSTIPASAPVATGLVIPVSVGVVASDWPEYDRGTWRHWTDEDSDCQNARQEVLIAESVRDVTYETEDQCRVDSGLWIGPYTGDNVEDPSALDVDHMVPLENAHRSGAWSWDEEQKREFANYLGYENHLIATTSRANRSKGSRGPEKWRPPLEEYWCVYAIDWVTIKNQWRLTVTEPEYLALSEMLATCDTTVLLQPRQGTPPSPPTPTVAPSLPKDLRYDPFGPDRNCGEFDTYDEALAFYLAAGGPESDPHRLDVNSNGEPCESLPGGPSAEESTAPADEAATKSVAPMPTNAPEDANCAEDGTSPGNSNSLPASDTGERSASDCLPAPPTAGLIPQRPPSTLAPTVTPLPTPAPTHAPVSSPTPVPTTPPVTPMPDVNCSDFSDWQSAQDFFESNRGPSTDPHGLDTNGDGVACQSLPGAPIPEASIPGTTTRTPTPSPTLRPTPVSKAFVGLPFDPNGPDRNCSDFSSWWDAQNFYQAAGGPAIDPHGLDRNGDGTACESLFGVSQDEPEPSTPAQQTSPSQDDFEDRNCSDFTTWQEAQDFFLSEGGPGDDPHRLDRDKDGEACESLPGAP